MTRLPLLCFLIGAACLQRAAADERVTSVEVTGMRDPLMHTYRGVSAGLDAFEQYRALAPDAEPVRFRLLPKDKSAAAERDLQVRIVGKGDAVVLLPDATSDFTVPRIAAAYDDDADVILNRKDDTYRGESVVRTKGLAPDVLRLGDLRLNCQVTVAIVKHEIGFIKRAAISTIMRTGDWCNVKDAHFAFSAPARQRIVAAYIADGEQRTDLRLNDKWSVMAPLGQPRWSDNALIHLSYEEPPTPAAAPDSTACADCAGAAR